MIEWVVHVGVTIAANTDVVLPRYMVPNLTEGLVEVCKA